MSWRSLLRADRVVAALTFAFVGMGLPLEIDAEHLSASTPTCCQQQSTLQQELTFGPSDSLALVLEKAGIGADQRQAVENAFSTANIPSGLGRGARIVLTFAADAAGVRRLTALDIDLDENEEVSTDADGGGDTGHWPVEEPPQTSASEDPVARSASGLVGTDLTASLLATGLPARIVRQVREALTYDSEIPVNLPPGSHFDILYNIDAHLGASSSKGELRCAVITIRGQEHRVYRFPVGGGLVAFLKPNGKGALQASLALPISHARISSAWGWRIHPVLNVPEFHKGIDFAAPPGTPVLAAADGSVVFAGRHGNYGLLIKIEHADQLETTYGHLRQFAKGIRAGSRVTKGQVIGYVGETGLSTGPHLYYEVFLAGEQVNPIKNRIAAVPIRLAGQKLRSFRQFVSASTQAASVQ